jgi:hypothetical protein
VVLVRLVVGSVTAPTTSPTRLRGQQPERAVEINRFGAGDGPQRIPHPLLAVGGGPVSLGGLLCGLYAAVGGSAGVSRSIIARAPHRPRRGRQTQPVR